MDGEFDLSGTYSYERVGCDSRLLELRHDGTIGVGADGCEDRWSRKWFDGRPAISISGDFGEICLCVQSDDGSFVGQWTQFDRMPIVMTPVIPKPIYPAKIKPRTKVSDTLKTASDHLVAGIPCLHRYDLLNVAIERLLAGSRVPDKIVVVDNGGGFKNSFGSIVDVYDYGRNLGWGASNNLIHRIADGSDTLFLNDDLFVGTDTVKRLCDTPGWFVTAYKFACFIVRRPLFETVGNFDEMYWPIYCEDYDLMCRIQIEVDEQYGETVSIPNGVSRHPGGVMIVDAPGLEHFDGGCKTGPSIPEQFRTDVSKRFGEKWGQVRNRRFQFFDVIHYLASTPYLSPERTRKSR